MGHPKKFKKKWKRPKKLFDKARIESEKELKKEYGFKRKKEIWRLEEEFKKIKRRARKILATKDKEAEKILINKLAKINLVKKDSSLEDVLNLKLEDLCDRRLQSILYKKEIANTVNQARQLITHKKIIVGDRIINHPNYIVSAEEEKKISVKKKVEREIKDEKSGGDEKGKLEEPQKEKSEGGKVQETKEPQKEKSESSEKTQETKEKPEIKKSGQEKGQEKVEEKDVKEDKEKPKKEQSGESKKEDKNEIDKQSEESETDKEKVK